MNLLFTQRKNIKTNTLILEINSSIFIETNPNTLNQNNLILEYNFHNQVASFFNGKSRKVSKSEIKIVNPFCLIRSIRLYPSETQFIENVSTSLFPENSISPKCLKTLTLSKNHF
ncbi:hypothetical protein [Leptospira kirschneri]|uniref:hypothetical protein n=1 Tax=Leptospira kirschneri TaxID=29507 RepID=UPI000297C444|nr:hypothetical protein [Leptospira kirschneri]EKQ84784.1 hypothetical protein LEP1GSC064_3094 [Leptospira kirschneri serovar Grippotyphosa str. Moskva]EKR09669.1 hypothetical protein LEP1GSC122_1919 [Leptospira kirschneri serovar Valbuzzi str. 200702274]EMK02664.1 hypothetical protein LEP1GSC176_1106 [Leptospira kirschneri str. MMD1493]EPG49018.1 hypothetical protein LEP1GSC049_1246 [Leptospira kirschneri serovar Cynopteri str. 3522 CT]OOV47197.1 hypothetical protein B1J94_16705 [Leptospira k